MTFSTFPSAGALLASDCYFYATLERTALAPVSKTFHRVSSSWAGHRREPRQFSRGLLPPHGSADAKDLRGHGRAGERRDRQSRREADGRPLLAAQLRARSLA